MRPPSARKRRWLLALAIVLLLPLAIPEQPVIPVEGATARDWNPQSFWYEPWGKSGVHKGIDIFAPKGRTVRSATWGLVVFRGELGLGGKVVAVLGPKWRLHYYAHLDESSTTPLALVKPGTRLGSNGASGNAAGKPPHLHYAVLSLLPRPWCHAKGSQGWKRMFFVDPGKLLAPAGTR